VRQAQDLSLGTIMRPERIAVGAVVARICNGFKKQSQLCGQRRIIGMICTQVLRSHFQRDAFLATCAITVT
jgi:hypothetical protein